jgi:hypothetical protein
MVRRSWRRAALLLVAGAASATGAWARGAPEETTVTASAPVHDALIDSAQRFAAKGHPDPMRERFALADVILRLDSEHADARADLVNDPG